MMQQVRFERDCQASAGEFYRKGQVVEMNFERAAYFWGREDVSMITSPLPAENENALDLTPVIKAIAHDEYYASAITNFIAMLREARPYILAVLLIGTILEGSFRTYDYVKDQELEAIKVEYARQDEIRRAEKIAHGSYWTGEKRGKQYAQR